MQTSRDSELEESSPEVMYKTMAEVEEDGEILWERRTGSALPLDSSGRTLSFYKKTAVIFGCLWILTLITALTVYSLQKQMELLERNQSRLTTELEQKKNSSLWSDCRDLKSYYRTVIESFLKCFPNGNVKAVRVAFAEASRLEGEVLEPVLEWIRNASVDVTLDPDTAQPTLLLSEDGKQVRHGNKSQKLPDNPERFYAVVCVLAHQNFISGRHYWEVEVGDKPGWDIGVAKQSINRKGKLLLSAANGFWTIWLRNENDFRALSSPTTTLPLSLKPRKVGVYVDYEEGQVSFYNVEKRSHIYTFTDTFTEKIYPYFSPLLNRDGKNSALLRISPISE